MSVPEREEEAEGWMALHNERVCNMYAAPQSNTISEWQSVHEHTLYRVWQGSEMRRKF